MPVITLNDVAIRALKPSDGKHITYIDRTLKGFGVRVTADGFKSFVLIYGKERKRVTLGHVGIIKLAEAREKAKDILADRQLNASQPERTDYQKALKQFLTGYAEKNKPSTVAETERLLKRYMPEVDKLHELTKALLVETLDDIEAKSERRHFYTAAYLTRINKLGPGTEVWVNVTDRTLTRSDAQNRLYWLYLHLIEEATGNDAEALHEPKAEGRNTHPHDGDEDRRG